MSFSIRVQVPTFSIINVYINERWDGKRLKSHILSKFTLSSPVNFYFTFEDRVISDSQNLILFGIRESSLINMVIPSSVTLTRKQQTYSDMNNLMENPELMAEMMNNPLVKSLTSNPEFMNRMIRNNPQIKRAIEQNPELENYIESPEFINQMNEVAKNPNRMQEMMRNADRTLLNIENIPGGFSLLSSFFRKDEEPGSSLRTRESIEDEEKKNEELVKKLNVPKVPSERPNDQPLPNPWSPSRNQHLYRPSTQPSINSNFLSLFSQLNLNRTSSSQNPSQIINHESLYSNQLQELEDMGFTDKEKNLRALIAANGNLDSAVDLIVKELGED